MKEKKVYTLEFKESSAKLAVSSEQSFTKTAQDLGIGVSTLCKWIQKYAPNSQKHLKNSNSSLTSELISLKKEVAKLRQERDILKKAAAYFANEIM